MAKRKKKNSSGSKVLTYISLGLAFVASVIGSLVLGYYFGYSDASEDIKKQEQILQEKKINSQKRVVTATKKDKQKSVNKRLKEVLKKEVKHKKQITKSSVRNIPAYQVSGAHEYDDPALDKPPKRAIKKVLNKPKLAIIIDDMSLKSQVKSIKSLGIPLTMSFMPPRSARPDSAHLASKEEFYMVHLPLGAMHFSKEEPHTLHVTDSQQTISKRVEEITKLFPRVRYINNHTGSKFTSNELAMNRLIFSLKKNNIQFIDSRTTSKTAVPKVMKNFGLRYMSRDVFLDHHMDEKYVLGQIKEAIRVAKLHGTAIAIGHPHPNTISALRKSKKLLKQVDLVYINKLY